MWVATADSHLPNIFDPRTGTNLTDFIPETKIPKAQDLDRPWRIVACAETGEAVTVSEHMLLCVWKYNYYSCVSIIRGHTDWVEVVVSNPRCGASVNALGF